jgi:glutathione S-transferase
MKLYYSPGACSLAPHIVAREAGVPVDLVKVDLKTHKLPDGGDFKTINPRGYVPMLELDGGERMTEASVLVQALADRAPASGLMPPSGQDRYRVQQWLAFVATELHKTFSPLWYPGTPDATKESSKAKLATRFAELDGVLGGRPYLAGETFTAADAYAFTIVNWANFLGIDLKPYPNLAAFMARVAARPKVREALAAEGLAK